MVNEEIVGTDIDRAWEFDAEGDLSLVRGSDNLAQGVYLRLTAYLDSLYWAYTNYGSIMKDWLGKNQNVYTRSTLIDEIRKRIVLDPRIADADVELEDWTPTTMGVKIMAKIVDGTTFQDYFIFSDLPRLNENVNSPQWKNTYIDTLSAYYSKQGEYLTVQCYVRQKNTPLDDDETKDKIVPIGEVEISIGGYHVDCEENPQMISQSGTEDPGSCKFTFRIPKFMKKGTHKLRFTYKGRRGYNNCSDEVDLHILERIPTSMDFEFPDKHTWYYANDYDEFKDPKVHVFDANGYDVLSGRVKYIISAYQNYDNIVFIEYPLVFHGSDLLERPVYIFCKSIVLKYAVRCIFRVNYMFRPGDRFDLYKNNLYLDTLECAYEDGIFYLITTEYTIPYADVDNNGNRLNTGRNKDIDTIRNSNCHIKMEVIE